MLYNFVLNHTRKLSLASALAFSGLMAFPCQATLGDEDAGPAETCPTSNPSPGARDETGQAPAATTLNLNAQERLDFIKQMYAENADFNMKTCHPGIVKMMNGDVEFIAHVVRTSRKNADVIEELVRGLQQEILETLATAGIKDMSMQHYNIFGRLCSFILSGNTTEDYGDMKDSDPYSNFQNKYGTNGRIKKAFLQIVGAIEFKPEGVSCSIFNSASDIQKIIRSHSIIMPVISETGEVPVDVMNDGIGFFINGKVAKSVDFLAVRTNEVQCYDYSGPEDPETGMDVWYDSSGPEKQRTSMDVWRLQFEYLFDVGGDALEATRQAHELESAYANLHRSLKVVTDEGSDERAQVEIALFHIFRKNCRLILTENAAISQYCTRKIKSFEEKVLPAPIWPDEGPRSLNQLSAYVAVGESLLGHPIQPDTTFAREEGVGICKFRAYLKHFLAGLRTVQDHVHEYLKPTPIDLDLPNSVANHYVQSFPDLLRAYERKPIGSQTIEEFGKNHWRRHALSEPARVKKMHQLGYFFLELTNRQARQYVQTFPDLLRAYERKPTGSQTIEEFGKNHWRRYALSEPARVNKMRQLNYIF